MDPTPPSRWSHPDPNRRVAIVGGGIAGLAAAYRLQSAPSPPDTVLLEAEARLGGKILTERSQGFLIEAGPDSFLSSKPGALRLCRQLGLDRRLEGPNEGMRRSFVLWRGALHQIPEGLSGLVPARLEPLMESDLFSAEGKDRLAREPEISPGEPGPNESLAAFVDRRFGRELYDRLIEPLMAGIYAGDGERLSLAATFPQLRRLEQEHGSVVRGLQRSTAQVSQPEPRLPAFLAPRGGMGELVAGLARKLSGVRMGTGVSAQAVTAAGRGYLVRCAGGDELRADSVILATPGHVTAALLGSLDRELSEALAAVPYVATATVSLGYRRAEVGHPLDGYGYVVPRAEGRPVLACTWVSSKFPDRVPPGFVLLRAFLGRRGQKDLPARPDRELLELVRTELREVLGITAPPALCRIHRWPGAMPQYELGHLDRLAQIEDRLESHPGLFLAGAAYRGVGVPDCITSGEEAAQRVLLSTG